MSRIPRWFDRKFEFSFPPEQYFILCVRLRGTPARLEELVGASTREALVWKPQEKWSAQEHAGHLLDVEPILSQRVTDFLSGATKLTAADLSNRKTYEANHNAHPVQTILSDFRVTRQRLIEQVEDSEPTLFSRAILHPRLKTQIRLVDHLCFMAEHDDHHLAHIWDLIHPQPNTGYSGGFAECSSW
jgi:hypothetical protein